jgi:hypothetical protein
MIQDRDPPLKLNSFIFAIDHSDLVLAPFFFEKNGKRVSDLVLAPFFFLKKRTVRESPKFLLEDINSVKYSYQSSRQLTTPKKKHTELSGC